MEKNIIHRLFYSLDQYLVSVSKWDLENLTAYQVIVVRVLLFLATLVPDRKELKRRIAWGKKIGKPFDPKDYIK